MAARADYRNCEAVSSTCPVEATTYGYYPSIAASGIFIFVFALCCLFQLALGIRSKTYSYMIAAALGTFGEAIGYGGRVLMHHNPWSRPGFRMQIVCLILAPSFLAASIYLTLKHAVRRCGVQYSRLKPEKYTWIFIGFDFGSILLQAAGGGVAAGGTKDAKLAKTGDNMIVAGIAFQAFTMLCFAVLAVEFYWRFRNQKPLAKRMASEQEKRLPHTQISADAGPDGTFRPDRKFKIFCWAVGFAFTTILIRCLYRYDYPLL